MADETVNNDIPEANVEELPTEFDIEVSQEPPVPDPSAEPVPDPSAEMKAVEQERDQFKDALIRERADFENYKKRNAVLEKSAYQRGVDEAALRVLPVLDNFERALQSDSNDEKFVAGMQLIMRQFTQALRGLGIEEIDTSGEFDPSVHHAVMQTEIDGTDSNHITETLQKGYRSGDRIIRPAMVKVNK